MVALTSNVCAHPCLNLSLNLCINKWDNQGSSIKGMNHDNGAVYSAADDISNIPVPTYILDARSTENIQEDLLYLDPNSTQRESIYLDPNSNGLIFYVCIFY